MKKGLVINEDVWTLIEEFNPDECKELLDRLAAYHRGEEVPPMTRMIKGAYQRIVLDNGRFNTDLSEIRRQAAYKRWRKDATDANNAKIDANDAKMQNVQEEKRIEEKRREKKRTEEIVFPPEIDMDYVKEAYKDFKAMRERIRKPMTKRAEELILKDLVKLSGGDAVTAKRILEQSTKNSWQGVFPLKENNNRGRVDQMPRSESKYADLDYSRLL